MNRAERRRLEKAKAKRAVTYNYKEEDLKNHVKDIVQRETSRERAEMVEDAVNQSMLLLFVLPMKVLMDFYWKKSYEKRIPEFTKHLLDYYSMWQNNELDMEKMKEELWEYGGVRLEIK